MRPAVYLIVAFVCVVAAVVIDRRTLSGSADSISCFAEGVNNADYCTMWTGSNQCRKGKLEGGACVYKESVYPPVLLVSAVILVLVAVYSNSAI